MSLGTIFLVIIFVAILVVLLAYQIFLYVQDKVLFLPLTEHIWEPNDQHEDIFFGLPPTYLHGWYFPYDHRAEDQRRVVLFCHGNTGNISHRRYVVDLCHEMQLSLFLFDYRGYGKSRGKSTLDTLKQDGDQAYRYLRGELGYRSDEIIIWGESLGGLVACHIASRYPAHRLLLMATYADLASLSLESESTWTKLAYPFLLWQDESNIKKLSSSSTPTLILHSIEDELIPYSHAFRLYWSINHQWKNILLVKGGHGNPVITPEEMIAIMRFCWQEPKITVEGCSVLDHIAATRTKHGF